MFEKLGVQLFTIRNYMKTEEEIAESFAKLKALGYTVAQTAGCTIPYEKFGALARANGIETFFPSDLHFSLPCGIL